MKKRSAVNVLLLAFLLVMVMASSVLAAPVPLTQADFTGSDSTGTSWEVRANATAMPALVDLPASASAPTYWEGKGLVSLTSWQSLPDGSQVKKAFTVRVKYNFSLEYFPVYGFPDAGAAAGLGGYVVSSKGEGVPSVGDFCEFLFWDGAQGLTSSDGTTEYFPDSWSYTPAADDDTWLRNFQRRVLAMYAHHGISTASGTYWPIAEGDIGIKDGLVFDLQ